MKTTYESLSDVVLSLLGDAESKNMPLECNAQPELIKSGIIAYKIGLDISIHVKLRFGFWINIEAVKTKDELVDVNLLDKAIKDYMPSTPWLLFNVYSFKFSYASFLNDENVWYEIKSELRNLYLDAGEFGDRIGAGRDSLNHEDPIYHKGKVDKNVFNLHKDSSPFELLEQHEIIERMERAEIKKHGSLVVEPNVFLSLGSEQISRLCDSLITHYCKSSHDFVEQLYVIKDRYKFNLIDMKALRWLCFASIQSSTKVGDFIGMVKYAKSADYEFNYCFAFSGLSIDDEVCLFATLTDYSVTQLSAGEYQKIVSNHQELCNDLNFMANEGYVEQEQKKETRSHCFHAIDLLPAEEQRVIFEQAKDKPMVGQLFFHEFSKQINVFDAQIATFMVNKFKHKPVYISHVTRVANRAFNELARPLFWSVVDQNGKKFIYKVSTELKAVDITKNIKQYIEFACDIAKGLNKLKTLIKDKECH
jgi:hypothetical protein